MEKVKYKMRSDSSKTPCPHGMMATCTNCRITKPQIVHVGSWMERDCPFFAGEVIGKKEVLCNYIPTDLFRTYNSR